MTLTQTDVDEAVKRPAKQAMFLDLLAAQRAMPAIQKSAINPHFKNKYVPLEELIQVIVPVLNEHNFILTQFPTTLDGQPALETQLRHVSGEVIPSTMLLLCAKDDPQGQGSAITYARRYSLMSLLGLAADLDDDGDKARVGMERQGNGHAPAAQRTVAKERNLAAEGEQIVQQRQSGPKCPQHGPLTFRAAGISAKTNKPYSAFWGCIRSCTANNGRGLVVYDDAWQNHLNTEKATEATDLDNLPQE